MDCPYSAYYLNQAGTGLPVIRGSLNQRGHGLGSLFSSLFKVATPLLKRGGQYLARHALKTGAAIANDVLAGENFRNAARRQFESTGHTIVNDANQYVEKLQHGNGSSSLNVNKKRRSMSSHTIKKSTLKQKQRTNNELRCTSVKKKKKKSSIKKKVLPSKRKYRCIDKLFES